MCDSLSTPKSKEVELFLGTGGYIGKKPELACANCKLNNGDHLYFGDFEDSSNLDKLSDHLIKHAKAGHNLDITVSLLDIVRWHWYLANCTETLSEVNIEKLNLQEKLEKMGD